MSYYEGLSFFVCLVIVLLVAIVIGALEKPLKWYSLLVSLLFVLHLVELADPWVF